MGISKKEAYKADNLNYLLEVKKQNDVKELNGGVLYKVVKKSDNNLLPSLNSIITVNYSGKLINGKIFDDSYKRGYPEAFRLRDVIEGWQIALQKMNLGDRWIIYIPYSLGYGNRTNCNIPAFSTLIFDVELLGIM